MYINKLTTKFSVCTLPKVIPANHSWSNISRRHLCIEVCSALQHVDFTADFRFNEVLISLSRAQYNSVCQQQNNNKIIIKYG